MSSPSIDQSLLEKQQYKQLPPEIVIEILSFLLIKLEFTNSERDFNRYYFGKFTNGSILYLFKTLDWREYIKPEYSRQVIRLQQLASNGRRIDLKGSRHNILKPPSSELSQVIDWLEKDLFKNVDPCSVKSLCISNVEIPIFVYEWALEKFRNIEELELDCYSEDSLHSNSLTHSIQKVFPIILSSANLKSLKRLNFDCIDNSLEVMFEEISSKTPNLESFNNRSLTSSFLTPQIYHNWRNLKSLKSIIVNSRLEYPSEPSSEEAHASFSAISQLKQLEKVHFGRDACLFGVPVCPSIKIMTISIGYDKYSTTLMETISENEQLLELNLDGGYWSKNEDEQDVFLSLNYEKLKNLKVIDLTDLTPERAQHLAKFLSLEIIHTYHTSMENDCIEPLLKLPKLKKITYKDYGENIIQFKGETGKVIIERSQNN